MRANLFKNAMLLGLLAVAGNSTLVNAQDTRPEAEKKDKKSTVHISITETEDGKTKRFERSYDVGDMSGKERDELIDKVLDSVGVAKKRNGSISIRVDDGDDKLSEKRKKVIIDHRDEREPYAFHYFDGDKDFRLDSEKLRRQFREIEREFKPKARVFAKDMETFGYQMADIWAPEKFKASSVRSLDVYANNPDNGVLNLRFTTPEKGDVTVTITDIKGKEVGKKEIKDFEGQFVGQIELKKNTKGTLFVTVVQNEDGTVKRVVIP